MTEVRRYLATDIGGTFTDLAAWDETTGALTVQKSPTSKDFSQGVLDAIDFASVPVAEIDQFRHGSTIAINAVLEGTGAKTALVTTAGFADVLQAGRGNRPNPFVLNAPGHRVLVPTEDRFEVDERILADGSVHRPLDPGSLRACLEQLRGTTFDAVVVCLLHSYANPVHEERVRAALEEAFPNAYVVTSHEVCKEAREFERTSTAVVHAYIGPIVRSYLHILETGLEQRGNTSDMLLMQSNCGLMRRDIAVRRPAAMMESGPASGVMGTIQLARELGIERCVAFDMGGTTAKASLVEDHRPSFLDVYYIGGYESGLPLLAPVVDIHEVGAGGGSIAWLDDVGALHVGPRSAGSDPGPICYGLGGKHPTVCDADLVLGRLHPGDTLGGSIALDAEAARKGIEEEVAFPLGLRWERAAEGIITIANALMAQAVRKVSIERGRDPRDFVLVAYGGAGPMHAVDVARELGIRRVVVPPVPGVFSSLGMLFSPLRADRSRSIRGFLSPSQVPRLRQEAENLLDQLRCELPGPDGSGREGTWLSMRYLGQEHARRIEVTDWNTATLRAGFEEVYLGRYEYILSDTEVEVTTVGAWREVPQPRPTWTSTVERGGELRWLRGSEHRIRFPSTGWLTAEARWRPGFEPGEEIRGPALIVESTSTTVLGPQDRAQVGDLGELAIDVGEA